MHFKADTVGNLGTIHSFPEQKVLYRSDTKAPLSVVSNRYQVVQPREVLEFYRDLTEVSGYELETAGILKGGRKFWALAWTGQTTVLKGNDQVNGYLLLATSCDGTLATTATPTTVRVVCNNTLTISLNGATQLLKRLVSFCWPGVFMQHRKTSWQRKHCKTPAANPVQPCAWWAPNNCPERIGWPYVSKAWAAQMPQLPWALPLTSPSWNCG